MKIFVLLILIISVAGCSAPRVKNETFIRDTTYIVLPPIIQGSGTPQILNDTIIQYIETRLNDTIVKLQYKPIEKIFTYFVKPDSVKVQVRDTLIKNEVSYIVEKMSFFKLLGYIALGFGTGVLAIVLLAQYFANKKSGL